MFLALAMFGGAAAISAAPEISAGAATPTVLYLPWHKMCAEDHNGREICFVGSGAQDKCMSSLLTITLVERSGNEVRELQVIVPRANASQSVRITIDQEPALSVPPVQCTVHGCMAVYNGGAELVAALKQGDALTAEMRDPSGQVLRLQWSLAGFAQVYDGPSTAPRVYEIPFGCPLE
jgi:invasion protein IalB